MLPPIQTASTHWQQADHPLSDFWALRSGTVHQPTNPPYQTAAAPPLAPYQQHPYSTYPAALAPVFNPPEYLQAYTAQQPLGWPRVAAAAPLHPTSAHHQQHASHHLHYMSEQHNTRQRRPQRQRAASRRRSYAAEDDDWEADAEENDGSCSSADLSYSSRHRDTGPATAAAAAAASSGGRRGHAPASIKTAQRWTQDEHDMLAAAVARFGNSRRWSEIAKHIPGRTGKQCRERWVNHMNPDCKKGSWDVAEELLLCKWHSILGSHWARITRKLEGRTENAVKNHWNAAMRSKYPMRRLTPLNMYVSHLRNNVEPSDALVKVLEALQEAHPELVAQTARAAADIVSRRLNPQSGAALGMPPNTVAAAGASIQQLGALGGLAGGATLVPPASGGSGPSGGDAAAPASRGTAANLAAFFEAAGQPTSQQQQQQQLPLQDRSPGSAAPHAVLAAAQVQQQQGMQWSGAGPAAGDAGAAQPSPFAGAEGAAAAAAATRMPTGAVDTRLASASPGQLSPYAQSAMRTGPAAAMAAAGEAGAPAAKKPRTSNSTHSTGSGVAAAASGDAAVVAADAVAREAAAGQQQQQLRSPGAASASAAAAGQQFAFHSPNMTSSQSNNTAAGRPHHDTPQQQLLLQGQLGAPRPLFQPPAPYQPQQPNPILAAAAARGMTVQVYEKTMVLATDAVIAVQDGACRVLFELEEGLRRQQVVAAAVAAAEQQQLLNHAAHHLPGGPGGPHTPQQHLLRTHTAPAAQLQHWQNQQQWHHTAAPYHLQQQQHLDHSAPEQRPSISSGDSFGAMLAVISGAPHTGTTVGQGTNPTLPAAGLRLAGLGSPASAVGSASGAGHGSGRLSLSGAQGNQPSTPISAALGFQCNPLAPSWSRASWQQQQPPPLQRSLSEFPRGSSWLETHVARAGPDAPMEAPGLSRQHWQQQQHVDNGAAAAPVHGKTVTTDAPAGRPLARTISAPTVRQPSPTAWAGEDGSGAEATRDPPGASATGGDVLALLPGSDGLAAPTPATSLPAVSDGGPEGGELQPLFDPAGGPLPPSTLQFQHVEEVQDNADKDLLDLLAQ